MRHPEYQQLEHRSESNDPRSDIFDDEPSSLQSTLTAENISSDKVSESLMKRCVTSSRYYDFAVLESSQHRGSSWTIGKLVLDILLASPALCFIVYGFMVLASNGKPEHAYPVPTLRTAALYSPTVFPIVFTAIVANFLKTVAAWKLERSISMLNLENLLGSRTVFSTITTPFCLRTVNTLTPLLIALWALSPLGGQAAFRLIGVKPSEDISPWDFSYLDYMSDYTNSGPLGGSAILPAVMGAFLAAMSSPAKAAGQDVFENVKIPMLEAFEASGAETRTDGWYDVEDMPVTYSSLIGLPISGLQKNFNYTLTLETSYMYTDCLIDTPMNLTTSWTDYRQNHSQYTDMNNMVIELGTYGHNIASNDSLQLVFTSFHETGVTNATCALKTTYIEAQVQCRWTNCTATRIRPSQKEHDHEVVTVLDGAGLTTYTAQQVGSHIQLWFLSGFVNSTRTPWDYMWSSRGSSPVEAYFTNPDSPFSTRITYKEEQVGYELVLVPKMMPADPPWTVGNTIFSQRFSQLINTWWLANIAPYAVTGNFYLEQPEEGRAYVTYRYQNSTGTSTPDEMVLHCNMAWFVVLLAASTTMLAAGLLAAVLVALRKGPDILDRTSSLMRDNPYALIAQPEHSMEDAFDQARRVKDVQVCLGDARPNDKIGYIALGTTNVVVPLSKLREKRLFS